MRRLSVGAVTVVTGLALVSCTSATRQPDARDFIGSPTVPAIRGEVPVSTAAKTDVNDKLITLARASEGGDLRLGAGDLIEVAVFDVPELSQIRVRIPNSGQIALPLIGTVTAGDLTALELQTAIATELKKKYMHDPQVSIFVHEHKSQRVSVIGAVKQGGVFTLTSEVRLADALALAGGITEEAGSAVYVIRGVGTEQEMTVIDLERLAAGRQELNLPLKAGDVIEVPRAGTFYVGGEVQKPGAFPLKTHTTLDQAATTAGGVKDTADWDDVRLYRTRPDGTKEVLTYSLNEFEAGKPGPELQANDVVIVGKSAAKATLYGVRDFFRFGIGMTVPR